MQKLLIVGFLTIAQLGYTQPESESYLSAGEVSVRDVVDSQLLLDAEEEAVFWPLFHRYFQEMQTRVNHRLLFWEKMQHITPLISDKEMNRYYRAYLTAQQQEWSSKRAYYRQLKQAFPPDKALRFLQIMEKCQVMIESQVLVTVPLIEPRRVEDTTGVDTLDPKLFGPQEPLSRQ